jgi:hypothetical protein
MQVFSPTGRGEINRKLAVDPEPFEYQYGFATKCVIEVQINQHPTTGNLSYKVECGVTWGAYFWAPDASDTILCSADSQPRSDYLIQITCFLQLKKFASCVSFTVKESVQIRRSGAVCDDTD